MRIALVLIWYTRMIEETAITAARIRNQAVSQNGGRIFSRREAPS